LSDIPLREFIERILTEHEKAHNNQHEAVALAARELERRLDLLNHAHERSVEDREQFARKSDLVAVAEKVETVRDTRNKEVEDHFKRVEERIEPLSTFKNRAVILGPVLVIIGSVIGAAITRVLLGG
jgi:hypothetical protein